MMLVSFLDELLKVANVKGLIEKHAYDGPTVASDPPAGMVDWNSPPPARPNIPDDVTTRLPLTSHRPSVVPTGQQGKVTPATQAIDHKPFNRPYEYS